MTASTVGARYARVVGVMDRGCSYFAGAASVLVGIALALPATSAAAGSAALTVSVQIATTCTVRTAAPDGSGEATLTVHCRNLPANPAQVQLRRVPERAAGAIESTRTPAASTGRTMMVINF